MSEQRENETDFVASAKAMQAALVAWRGEHPEASFDEIAEEVRKQREVLMGELLAELAGQHGVGEVLVEGSCPQCGGALHYKGVKGRTVLHPEGQPQLVRGYHHCDQCGHGFFPLDEALGLGAYSWSPWTVAQALRLAVEIPSYRRAATAFGELLHLPCPRAACSNWCRRPGRG